MPNRQKAIHRGVEQSIYSFQAPMTFQSVKLTDLFNREKSRKAVIGYDINKMLVKLLT